MLFIPSIFRKHYLYPTSIPLNPRLPHLSDSSESAFTSSKCTKPNVEIQIQDTKFEADTLQTLKQP